ncbi:MAG TPA: DUF3971 domain-containing protein [Xanthobacteraceae bacterium]|nr:DUF3971 domain-containing protein [Xanthobacteraceae bacterium]
MKRTHLSARDSVLRKLEAFLHWYRLKRARAAHKPGTAARGHSKFQRALRGLRMEYRRRRVLLRRIAISIGAVGLGALWWRLSSGPIALDVATPWLTAAIERNLGDQHRITVGGTVLERDTKGRTALRLRDIVVRSPDGEVLASAPRAEIGISGASLLLGRPRVVSFLLVGANMEIRIESDGHVEIYAGGQRPFFAIAPMGASPAPDSATQPLPPKVLLPSALAGRNLEQNAAALLSWIDGLGALGRNGHKVKVTGLDGYELTEIGVKNGSLVVDDARNGRQWSFTHMTLSLSRPDQGGIAFSASSESEERSWSLSAAVLPTRGGNRLLRFDANHVMLDHLLLLFQIGDGQFHSMLPISADIRAEIAPNGMPQQVRGRIVASGYLGHQRNPDELIPIDLAHIQLNWDIARGTLQAPFQLISGTNRLTLYAELTPPLQRDGIMTLSLQGGTVVLDPMPPERDPLVLKRIAVRLRHDLAKQRIELEQADLGADDGRNVGLALSGSLDYSRDDPQLSFGLAGAHMSVPALKRLWPPFVSPKVRKWVMEHVFSGTVGQIDVAINAPWSTLVANGPPIPDAGLAVDVSIAGAAFRPVDGLPMVRDADVKVHVTGRTATVSLGRGIAEVSPGRRLIVSNAVFEVPDMNPDAPPTRVRFRLDGSVASAAELMASEKLRAISGMMIEPAASRGTMNAQVTLNLPLVRDLPNDAINYNINIDLNNFSAERMMLGKKVEAKLLRVAVNNEAYQIKGDVRINGTPAHLEYRRVRGEGEPELRIEVTLDDATRARLGIALGGAVSGPIPVKLSGRIPANEREARLTVEADLTAARIDNLLPGWVKPAGRPVRATFALITRDQSTRLEDIFVDGSGAMLRGSIEVDSASELLSANLPVFALSEGDKAALKAERGTDGVLRVTMRGDIFDGRSVIRAWMSGAATGAADRKQKPPRDLDLDIKVSRLLGHHGETLRSLEMRMSRRAGHLRGFALNATLGRDSPLKGDLRELRDLREARPREGQVLYLDSNDAGALLRFTDTYPRMSGGRIWILMEPPKPDQSPQDGLINIRDFTIRGERDLAGVLPNAPDVQRDSIPFASMRVEFTRVPGKLTIRDGVVRGPVLGVTIDGTVDYQRDEVHLRGTFVPLYVLNNMFSQIPIVGLVLGGGSTNTGVFGITYEVVGTAGQPMLRINPASALAPGILRKFFEFPAGNGAGRPAPLDPAR